jgi:hypothetical protein
LEKTVLRRGALVIDFNFSKKMPITPLAGGAARR